MNNVNDIAQNLYNLEREHSIIFKKAAMISKDKKIRSLLIQLSKKEAYHKSLWSKFLDSKVINKNIKLKIIFYSIILRLLGLPIAIKIIEAHEKKIENEFSKLIKSEEISEEKRKIIKELFIDEINEENKIKLMIIKNNRILKNIKDVIIGMNDGLVEVLAAISGIATATNSNIIVLISGLIIALSGALSMAGGAFVASDYEKQIFDKRSESYVYIGGSYVLGAMFPLFPFIIGLKGIIAVVFAIILTSIAISIVASIIAIVSNYSVMKNVSKSLLISIGSASIAILAGIILRTYFSIT